MRYITKGTPDCLLAKAHENPPKNANKAKQRWKNFGRAKKKPPTRKKCFKEQFGLCGYSEVGLINQSDIKEPNYDELDFHLEHIVPKSVEPQRTFDHYNIIACAIKNQGEQISEADTFGGHARLDDYDPELFIHPLMQNCSRYFHYEETTGKVVAKARLSKDETEKALYTIDILCLNSSKLVQWRKDYLACYAKKFDDYRKADDKAGLKEQAKRLLLPRDQKLQPFYSALKQMLGQISDEISDEINDE